MKKTLTVLIILCTLFAAFSAGATEDGGYRYVTTKAFDASLSLDRGTLAYKLHTNPASLAQNRLIVQFPSVAVEDYNFAKTISNPSVAEAISNLMKFKGSKQDLVKVGVGLIENVGMGYNEAFGVNVEAGAAIGKFGFGVDVAADVKTMPIFKPGTEEPIDYKTETQSLLKTGVVPVADVALTAAYGTRVYEGKATYLDAGISVRAIRRMYLEQITAQSLVDGGTDFASIPGRGGFAFPVDLGLTYGVMNGLLEFYVTANNLNGYFYMQKYAGYEDMLKMANGYDKYTYYTPWSLNAGFEFKPGWKTVSPSFLFRFEDIIGYLRDDLNEENGKQPLGELLTHLTFRVDVSLIKALSVNAAFRNGYLEFGTALNAYGNTIELSYGYHEAGFLYGEKAVDTFTLRVKLGFDNN